MTFYRWTTDELDHTVHIASGVIANLSYHFNRAHGLLARLHGAIAEDATLAIDSLAARKLKHDARALRTLATQLDRAAKKLTGDTRCTLRR
jgi:hypothetical protein